MSELNHNPDPRKTQDPRTDPLTQDERDLVEGTRINAYVDNDVHDFSTYRALIAIIDRLAAAPAPDAHDTAMDDDERPEPPVIFRAGQRVWSEDDADWGIYDISNMSVKRKPQSLKSEQPVPATPPAPEDNDPAHSAVVSLYSVFQDDVPEAPAAAAAKQSVRKPHNNLAGYIAELKNRRTGIGHVVIYRASETGIDVGDNRWVVVCETHGTMVGCSSMPQARAAMKAVDFCEECAALDAAKGGTR